MPADNAKVLANLTGSCAHGRGGEGRAKGGEPAISGGNGHDTHERRTNLLLNGYR
jgi:hypothetical protein